MNQPPNLMLFSTTLSWSSYEDALYSVYLTTVVNAGLTFNGVPIKTRFHPDTRGKGFGFWHLISEEYDPRNPNEDERIPDLQRCARVPWVSWCISNAGQPGFSWWENERKGKIHVVIWAEEYDFAVVLAKRDTQGGSKYYLLKTCYCLKPHRKATFAKERDAFWS